MKKYFIALILCFVSVLCSAQLNIKRDNKDILATNAFGDAVVSFNNQIFLQLEFYIGSTSRNRQNDISVGYKYIKLGDDIEQSIFSLNQMLDLISEKITDKITIQTKDNLILTISKDWQGGLEFNYDNDGDKTNYPLYSVIYDFRIKSLNKKLNKLL